MADGLVTLNGARRPNVPVALQGDLLGDTPYSFGRAHVHLNLVDMTATCAAKRPVLEAHARR